ncbi:MAG: hypothetical protein OXN17_13930 [Candidatus Poribacteria bacterium]|nr:hypothetical protein [Candidatus Poribacteria bacterium]
MRELTKREKTLLCVVGVICLIVFIMRGLPTVLQGLAGARIADKHERLQTAENLVLLDRQASGIGESLRELVGLRGRLISDSLFDEISQLHTVQTLNQTRRTSDFTSLHPALEGKAEALFAYKNQRGGFANLEELKSIQASIFEGEQPRVVISQRISQLARRSGVRPDYQLNIKPSPSKKTEKISHQAKRNFILYSYTRELETELKQLKELEQQKTEQSEPRLDEEVELERAMFEGWWGDYDSVDANNGDGNGRVLQEPKPAEEDAEIDTDSGGKSSTANLTTSNRDHLKAKNRLSKGNLSFRKLPAIIPLELRATLIEFILSSVTSELHGATEFKRGFFSDQISRVDEGPSRKFLGFGRNAPSGVQVKLRENSVLLAKFEDLIRRYEANRVYDAAESTDDVLDYDEQIVALTEYVDDTELQIKQLENLLAGVTLTHQPELYVVEMKFKSGVGTVVKLLESIDTSTKWLYVRNLKIVNDKSEKKDAEEETKLGVELSMTARIL